MDGPIRSIPKDAYAALVGTEVGVTDWLRIEQSRIDAFAAATDDTHFIHVDPQRAATTPLRGTVAHGYLTLSMLSRMAYEICPSIDGARFPLNYGFNRLRFVAPVPSGARVRGRFALKSFEHQADTRWVSTWDVTVEIEGGDKPALVAEWLTIVVL